MGFTRMSATHHSKVIDAQSTIVPGGKMELALTFSIIPVVTVDALAVHKGSKLNTHGRQSQQWQPLSAHRPAKDGRNLRSAPVPGRSNEKG